MRKIILSMMLSVDNFIETPEKDISWHVWNQEMEDYMIGFMHKADTFILGRKTYELMAGYWPSQEGEIARIMNETPKIVFSNSLDQIEWNAKLLKGIDAEEIRQLKQQPGKDMVIFGGADLASGFIQRDLIDEYQLIVNPVVLGDGNPFFSGRTKKINLRLRDTKVFSCGNVMLYYQP